MKYYYISGPDNNSMFYYNNDSILKHCLVCGLIINRNEAMEASINTFKIKKKNYNLSTCYDGPTIVSDKFIDIYSKYQLEGLLFVPLPKSPGFSLLKYANALHYDYPYNPYLYLKDKCILCDQWYEVSRVFPIKFIDVDEEKMEARTFYKTDLEAGEKVMRSSLLLVTEDIPFIFKQEKLKDIYFEVAGLNWVPGNPKANIYK